MIETMAAIDPAAYRIGAAAVWLADQRDRAKAVGVPTLILVGEEDGITPPALSEELADLIPGSTPPADRGRRPPCQCRATRSV